MSMAGIAMTDKLLHKRIHTWVYKELKNPTTCIIDKDHKAVKYHWANISQQYKLELSDWIQLCPKCHSTFDRLKLTIPELIEQNKRRMNFIQKLEIDYNEYGGRLFREKSL